MDVLSVYEYILSRIAEDLTPYGYQKSGKSALFYRYSADKRVGCVFKMQKSINNYTDIIGLPSILAVSVSTICPG